jgi:hypothetical protein
MLWLSLLTPSLGKRGEAAGYDGMGWNGIYAGRGFIFLSGRAGDLVKGKG